MDSALGNYIHLHTINYIKYGTNTVFKQTNNPYISYNNFMKQRTASLNSKGISSDTIDKLRFRIASDSETRNQRDLADQKQWQKMIDQVYQDVSIFTQQDLLKSIQYGKEINRFRASLHGYKQAKSMTSTASVLQQKIRLRQKIMKEISEINQQGTVTEKRIQKVINWYQQLASKETQYKLDSSLSSLGEIKKALINLTYENQINSLYGAVGEHLVYSVRDSANYQGQKIANNFIEGVVGKETSDITFKSELIAEKMEGFSFKDDTNTEYSITATQDKVDVKMIFNGEEILASVKNYKDLSNDNVKLQSEVNLFFSLLFLNQYLPNFGNHWINLHTVSSFTNQIFQGYREDADNILKQEMAYEALVSGNPLKTNALEATVFIAIDRNSGQVFIQNTKTILDDLDHFSITPKISKVVLANTKADNVSTRIKTLLAAIHNKKFTVFYRTNLHKNY